MAINQPRRYPPSADVGDLFMSLIYTAQLRGENPFDYLTMVQRHERAAAKTPADWLPWTYRNSLARLAEPAADPRASSKAGSPLCSSAPPAHSPP